MTTPTPRWTPETEELVRATCFDAMACAPWPPSTEEEVIDLIEAGELPEDYDREAAQRHADVYVAEQILTALADAGLLTAPDIEPNRQYGRRRADGLLLATSLPDPTHYRLIGPWQEVTDGE